MVGEGLGGRLFEGGGGGVGCKGPCRLVFSNRPASIEGPLRLQTPFKPMFILSYRPVLGFRIEQHCSLKWHVINENRFISLLIYAYPTSFQGNIRVIRIFYSPSDNTPPTLLLQLNHFIHFRIDLIHNNYFPCSRCA